MSVVSTWYLVLYYNYKMVVLQMVCGGVLLAHSIGPMSYSSTMVPGYQVVGLGLPAGTLV